MCVCVCRPLDDPPCAGVRTIYGVKNGYRGFYSENLMTLDPQVVDSIQHKGGTILGTSRGGSEISKIVDSIQARGINQLYVIGGDGTQRGANAIYLEARARGLKVRRPLPETTATHPADTPLKSLCHTPQHTRRTSTAFFPQHRKDD